MLDLEPSQGGFVAFNASVGHLRPGPMLLDFIIFHGRKRLTKLLMSYPAQLIDLASKRLLRPLEECSEYHMVAAIDAKFHVHGVSDRFVFSIQGTCLTPYYRRCALQCQPLNR
jgi:hypothetical protein